MQEYLEINDFEVLSEAKARAGEKQFNNKGASVTWFRVDFNMLPSGSRGYEWIMSNADIKVCIAKEARGGRVMPEIYMTFSSLYLWTKGIRQAMVEVEQWLSKWATIKASKVSRADLCLDISMPFPEIDLKTETVTRARRKERHNSQTESSDHITCKRSTGYTIGKGSLMLRIYGKTTEVKVSQKEWFRDIWLNNGWDGKQTVTRFEFQARRNFLKEMGVNSFTDLLERLADIWRYCTNNWLRICIPGSGSNQTRWQCKNYWLVVQDSFSLFGQAYGVLRYKAKDVQYNHLIKQIRGCAVSACATKYFKYGAEQVIGEFKENMDKLFSSDEFKQDVQERQAKMSNIGLVGNKLIETAISEFGAKIIEIE